jgi:hypothetical protein
MKNTGDIAVVVILDLDSCQIRALPASDTEQSGFVMEKINLLH